jgi:hypothetical protein
MRGLIFNNRGFTIVEVLISAVVAIILILSSLKFVVDMNNLQAKNNRFLNHRVAMSRFASEIFSNPGNFPKIAQGGSIGIFVFCLDRDGNTINPNSGFETPALVFLKNPGDNPKVCSDSSYFSLQISPEISRNFFRIDVYELKSSKGPVFDLVTTSIFPHL